MYYFALSFLFTLLHQHIQREDYRSFDEYPIMSFCALMNLFNRGREEDGPFPLHTCVAFGVAASLGLAESATLLLLLPRY